MIEDLSVFSLHRSGALTSCLPSLEKQYELDSFCFAGKSRPNFGCLVFDCLAHLHNEE